MNRVFVALLMPLLIQRLLIVYDRSRNPLILYLFPRCHKLLSNARLSNVNVYLIVLQRSHTSATSQLCKFGKLYSRSHVLARAVFFKARDYINTRVE
jgi:hypothetical protein